MVTFLEIKLPFINYNYTVNSGPKLLFYGLWVLACGLFMQYIFKQLSLGPLRN